MSGAPLGWKIRQLAKMLSSKHSAKSALSDTYREREGSIRYAAYCEFEKQHPEFLLGGNVSSWDCYVQFVEHGLVKNCVTFEHWWDAQEFIDTLSSRTDVQEVEAHRLEETEAPKIRNLLRIELKPKDYINRWEVSQVIVLGLFWLSDQIRNHCDSLEPSIEVRYRSPRAALRKSFEGVVVNFNGKNRALLEVWNHLNLYWRMYYISFTLLKAFPSESVLVGWKNYPLSVEQLGELSESHANYQRLRDEVRVLEQIAAAQVGFSVPFEFDEFEI